MRLEVLFIVGKGRSGSTLVGDTLGSLEGVFHAGELWRLWSHGLVGSHRCSCDRPLWECPVWGAVLARLADDPASAWSIADPDAMVELQRQFFTFSGVLRPRTKGRRDVQRYIETMAAVYSALATTTGTSVIVDSSKWPMDPMIDQASADDISPAVLHLVKDPRDVAASWRKEKTFPDTGAPMPRFGPMHTATSWVARTWAAERAIRRSGRRGTTVRFEDFLADPTSALQHIADLLDDPPDVTPAVPEPGHVLLQPGHTVMGNPGRFITGTVELMDSPSHAREPLVGTLTLPWRRRYGYR